jgi:hypothetical protein
LSAGTDTITALYSGDTTYAASPSNSVVETINPVSDSTMSADAVDAAISQDTNWLQP